MKIAVKTKAELEAAVKDGLALVDFKAAWCGPCKMMESAMEREILPALPALKVVGIDVDASPDLAAAYGVMSIPFMQCWKDGTKTAEFTGVTPAGEIIAALS